MTKKQKIMYQLKRGIKQYREERGKAGSMSQEFATVTELAAVMGYDSIPYFKRQWTNQLIMLPPNIYSVDDFAEAWVKGDIPVNKKSRGRFKKEGSYENE